MGFKTGHTAGLSKAEKGKGRPALKGAIPLPKPFVKWAGGKRQLIDLLLENLPRSFDTFFEPFAGGGALLFALKPKRAVISDVNAELINAYRVIRDDLSNLVEGLKVHRNEADYFYSVRALNPGGLSEVERASRFIFLNKTCFNGLYRENSRGVFNAPFGRYKNPNICDEENLRAVSAYLNSADVRIFNQDFKKTVLKAKKGDLVYFDPPYHPISETASFTKYSKGDFGVKSQEELAVTFRRLSDKGVNVMLSNSNTEFIRSLYRGYDIIEIEANRFINCKAERRGKGLFEVLVKSWQGA